MLSFYDDLSLLYKYPQNIQFIYNDSINITNGCELDKWGIVSAWVILFYSHLLCAQKVLAVQEKRQRRSLGKTNARDEGNAEDQY